MWRSRILLVAIVNLVCCCALAGRVSAQKVDPALQRQFLEGVREASRRLDLASFRVKCKVTQKNVTVSDKIRESFKKRNADPFKASTREFEMAIKGPLCLQKKMIRGGIEQINIRNTEYLCSISRPPKGGKPSLAFLEAEGKVGAALAAQFLKTEEEARGVALQAYYFLGHSLARMVEDQAFKVQGISTVQVDGKEYVRVEFQYDLDRPAERVRQSFTDGYLICDARNLWALHEYGCTMKNFINNSVSRFHVQLMFGEPVDGVPFATQVKNSVELLDDKGSTMLAEYSLDVERGKEIPKEEFYLTFYGLLEPNFSAGIQGALLSKGGVWLWYLVGGGVCLLVGVMFFRWRKARG